MHDERKEGLPLAEICAENPAIPGRPPTTSLGVGPIYNRVGIKWDRGERTRVERFKAGADRRGHEQADRSDEKPASTLPYDQWNGDQSRQDTEREIGLKRGPARRRAGGDSPDDLIDDETRDRCVVRSDEFEIDRIPLTCRELDHLPGVVRTGQSHGRSPSLDPQLPGYRGFGHVDPNSRHHASVGGSRDSIDQPSVTARQQIPAVLI